LVPNDPWYQNWQIPLQLLDVEAAWDVTTGSASVPIAVLDTGLDTDHFEFVNRTITGYDFADRDPNFYDIVGHGTIVAGVLGASANNGAGIAGATWDNPIMVLRSAFGLDVVDAITWATDNGARVITMSFGGHTATSWEAAAMQYAFDHGVVLVGAAGNDGTSLPFYPAAYTTVLAVTGVDASGDPIGYNWGDWIDLSAPGGGVLTTYRTENSSDGLGTAGGTSISAPFVAGAAGLVLSVNPDLTPTQVMDILRNTADDLGDPGFDPLTGYGRVNFHQAVLAAQGATPDPDVRPPSVDIADPREGDLLPGGFIPVVADANDDVRVTQVDLYVDGALVSSDTVAPHAWNFDTTTTTDGTHTFSATAYDAAGNSGQSAPVSAVVDNTAPTVSLTEPASGSDVSGAVDLVASASDLNGIDHVTFKVDGAGVAQVSQSPWSAQWDSTTVADGLHVLRVEAFDAAGNSASTSVTVSVANSPGAGGDDGGDAGTVSETFDGTLNRKHTAYSFPVNVSAAGPIQVEITFGGNRRTRVGCAVLDAAGDVIGQAHGGSPVSLTADASNGGTYTIRVSRVKGNANFTATVTHP
jgi:thermitase